MQDLYDSMNGLQKSEFKKAQAYYTGIYDGLRLAGIDNYTCKGLFEDYKKDIQNGNYNHLDIMLIEYLERFILMINQNIVSEMVTNRCTSR